MCEGVFGARKEEGEGGGGKGVEFANVIDTLSKTSLEREKS